MLHPQTGIPTAFRTLSAAALIAACLVLSFAGDSIAGNAGVWTATEVTGDARIRRGDGEWERLIEGQEVGAGSEIEAGQNSQITLVRSGDSITFSPGSRAAVPADTGDGSGPSLLQRLGTLLFRMETRESRDFTVQTPVLAAAVKGTVFTVTVDGDSSMVHVAEGMVEVMSLSSGELEMVGPGGTTTVMADESVDPSVVDGKPVPGDRQAGDADDDDADTTLSRITVTLGVAEVDVTTASGGFVSEDETTKTSGGNNQNDPSYGSSDPNGNAFGHDVVETETLEDVVDTQDSDIERNDPPGNNYGLLKN